MLLLLEVRISLQEEAARMRSRSHPTVPFVLRDRRQYQKHTRPLRFGIEEDADVADSVRRRYGPAYGCFEK
jgi:hypothetical protein